MHYRLKVPKEKRATVERALEHHEGLCAASESVRRGITVEWDSEIVEESEAESAPPRHGCPQFGLSLRGTTGYQPLLVKRFGVMLVPLAIQSNTDASGQA